VREKKRETSTRNGHLDWVVMLLPAVLGIFPFALCFLGLGISGVSSQWRQFTQPPAYTQGTCTILSARLDETSDYDTENGTTSTYYRPEFTLSVHPTYGDSYRSNGHYDQSGGSSDREEQQAIVNSYKPEHSYPCWYKPGQPSETVLSWARPQPIDHFIIIVLTVLALILGIFLTLLGIWVIWLTFTDSNLGSAHIAERGARERVSHPPLLFVQNLFARSRRWRNRIGRWRNETDRRG